MHVFEFGIGKSIYVTIELVPIRHGNRHYGKIRYYGRYNMVLVRYTIQADKKVEIYIPFYRSSGTNSSSVAANMWFPFVYCSHGLVDGKERYYHSVHGEAYIFKVGRYLLEPFSLTKWGEDHYHSTDMVGQRDYLRYMGVNIDTLTSQGVESIYHRFGNLLYLMTSVIMFGVSTNLNYDLYEPGTVERGISLSFDKIINDRKIDGKSWISLMPKYEPEFDLSPNVDNAGEVNMILCNNLVALPNDNETICTYDNLSSRFMITRSIIQIIGELAIDHSERLYDRLNYNINRLASFSC